MDYFVGLNIKAIWISPVYKSPMKDFGYDVEDFEDIDPIFGTMEEFDSLLKTVHDKGENWWKKIHAFLLAAIYIAVPVNKIERFRSSNSNQQQRQCLQCQCYYSLVISAKSCPWTWNLHHPVENNSVHRKTSKFQADQSVSLLSWWSSSSNWHVSQCASLGVALWVLCGAIAKDESLQKYCIYFQS